jgi:hypothetical protein
MVKTTSGVRLGFGVGGRDNVGAEVGSGTQFHIVKSHGPLATAQLPQDASHTPEKLQVEQKYCAQ